MRIDDIVKQALIEDLGSGDITTDFLDLAQKHISAYIVSKQDGVLCGLQVALLVFKNVDESIKCIAYKKDGDFVKKGDTFLKIEGYSNSILKAERVALNFLQRMSGIATMTRLFVEAIKPYQAKLLDTRKTTPLHRDLEKYAVKIGGGFNHRFGLYDMVLIKENHIRSVGSISEAVNLVKKHNTTYKIEVEVTSLEELEEASKCGVDRVMLDNMDIEMIYEAVQKYSSLVELEVSGNVSLETINKIASTGVDFISCGALTHSYKSMDFSLIFMEGI